MTYIGAPSIYYGSEVAMEGGKDPDCRRPFVWDYAKDAPRTEVLEWYRKLGQLRRAQPALRTGEFQTVLAEGRTYAFTRTLGEDRFLVVMNAGMAPAAATVDLSRWGGDWTAIDALGSDRITLAGGRGTLSMAPLSGRVYRLTR
jgi:glycosidase